MFATVKRLAPASLLAIATVFASACATASPAPAVAETAPAETRQPQTGQPQTGVLEVRFENLKAPTGALMVGVYADQASYEGGRAVAGGRVAVSGGAVTVRYEGLAPGVYGIKVFHDVNGDGTLNANPFGIPTEPFVFSNNAPAMFGPPSWDAARFTVTAGVTVQTLRF